MKREVGLVDLEIQNGFTGSAGTEGGGLSSEAGRRVAGAGDGIGGFGRNTQGDQAGGCVFHASLLERCTIFFEDVKISDAEIHSGLGGPHVVRMSLTKSFISIKQYLSKLFSEKV